MKKLTKQALSLILVLSMTLTLCIPAFAYPFVSEIPADDTITQEEIEALREAYAALSAKAKEIYLASLRQDPDAWTFHKKYIDPSEQTYTISGRLYASNAMTATAANANVVTSLVNQLQAIPGMPQELISAFRIMASGLVSDALDGPLPFGKIIAAAGTAAVVTVMAANWDTVAPLFPKILNAFKQAFSDSANQIVQAFNTLKAEAKEKADKAKIDKIRKEINKKNKKLLDANGNIDLNKFDTKKHGGGPPTWIGPLDWMIQRDMAEHGGRYWKLLDSAGQRIASLARDGKILAG